jgi:hypothetical protein
MSVFTRIISVFLVPVVGLLPLYVYGQSSEPVSASQSGYLQIKVLEREAPALAAGSRELKGYTLLITDFAGHPVSGAAVVFRLPDSPPTGTLADGSHSVVLYTDNDGRVHTPPIQWGATPGTVSIRVTANKDLAHAAIELDQNLTAASPSQAAPVVSISTLQQKKTLVPGKIASATPDPITPNPTQAAVTVPDQEPQVSISGPPAGEKIHSGSKKKWVVLAIVAAAGAGAAGFAMKGKSSSSSTSTPGLSIGTPTISVGQTH